MPAFASHHASLALLPERLQWSLSSCRVLRVSTCGMTVKTDLHTSLLPASMVVPALAAPGMTGHWFRLGFDSAWLLGAAGLQRVTSSTSQPSGTSSLHGAAGNFRCRDLLRKVAHASKAPQLPAHCLNLVTLESKAANTSLGTTKTSTAGTQRQTHELQGDESMNDLEALGAFRHLRPHAADE